MLAVVWEADVMVTNTDHQLISTRILDCISLSEENFSPLGSEWNSPFNLSTES